MIVLRELAPAKINLYLHVTGKRADGYHLLDSLVGFADVNDKIEVAPADTLTLSIETPYAAQDLVVKENTVLQAANALKSQFNVTAGAAITLHKHLPIAAGMGGGSADAAAALRLLSRFWKLKPTQQELNAIALPIGADVPACLRASSLYMSGIGESIETGPPLAGVHLLLVHPGKPLATAEVFAAYKGANTPPSRHPHAFATPDALLQFLHKTKNDLQDAAIKLLPEIDTVIKTLSAEKDCLLSRMSGSGATCFGIFATQQAAETAAQKITELHPSWWIKTSTLR